MESAEKCRALEERHLEKEFKHTHDYNKQRGTLVERMSGMLTEAVRLEAYKTTPNTKPCPTV